jgi:hypothetical protein
MVKSAIFPLFTIQPLSTTRMQSIIAFLLVFLITLQIAYRLPFCQKADILAKAYGMGWRRRVRLAMKNLCRL